MSIWAPSPAAKAASVYFNSLPIEERRKLAPLLDNYRQLGLAEARDQVGKVALSLDERIARIRAEEERA
jgi:hypothetical protein